MYAVASDANLLSTNQYLINQGINSKIVKNL